MIAIFKRELKAYFHSMYAFIFAVIFLIASGVLSYIINFSGGESQIEYVLGYLEILLLVIVPILAMRSMAEDNKNKTDRFLLTLPISPAKIVIGKYLALVAVFTLPVLILCAYPPIFSAFTTDKINFLGAYMSIFAFWLLGLALLAVCMYISSLTENLIVAAILSIVASILLYVIDVLASLLPDTAIASFIALVVIAVLLAAFALLTSRNANIATIVACVLIIPLSLLFIFKSSVFEGLFVKVMQELGLFTRFNSYFINGIFDLPTVIMYLSVAIFFVFLSAQTLDRKRWL